MNRKDLVLGLLAVTVWGVNFTVIKLGLADMPALVLASLRFVFAAVPALLFVRPPAVSARHWVTYGFLVGVGQFGCLFYAMHVGMPAGVASVVMQSQPFFTLAFATVLLQESVSPSQIVGLCVAAVGLYLMGQSGNGAAFLAIPPAAFLLTLTAAAFWGLSNIIVRKAASAAAAQGTQLDMLSLVVWGSIVPPLPLMLLACLLETPEAVIRALTSFSTLSIFAILYIAYAATIFGFSTWSKLLSRHPTHQVAPLSLLVPVTGLITARLVLGEQLAVLQWLGCILILLGLLVSTFGFPKLRHEYQNSNT